MFGNFQFCAICHVRQQVLRNADLAVRLLQEDAHACAW